MSGLGKSDQDSEQQKSQPRDEAAEVVTGGGEYGVDGVAGRVGEMIAPHAVIVLEMTYYRLDGSTAFERAFDLIGDAALLARRVDPEPVLGRSVVAAVSGVGDDAFERVAEKRLDPWNDRGERVPVVRVARQRRDMGDELSAGGMLHRRGDAHLDAELVRLVRLALADAFDFRRVQRVHLVPALAALLGQHATGEEKLAGEGLLQPLVAGDAPCDVADDPAEIGLELA